MLESFAVKLLLSKIKNTDHLKRIPLHCLVMSRETIQDAQLSQSVTECLTSDIFSMLLCGVSDCIIVFSIVLAP